MARITLNPAPPYRLDLTVWVLRRLPINQMDHWDGHVYRRVLNFASGPVAVVARQTSPPEDPELLVTTDGARITAKTRDQIQTALTRMLGLNVDLSPFIAMAHADPQLWPMVAPFEGFRPPRLPSLFETLVNGISCQQLSLAVGIHLLNRLSAEFGPAVGEQHAFPRPEELAQAKPSDLRVLGYSGRKAEVIVELARAVSEGGLDLEALSDLDDEAAVARLCQIRGVGRWTAEYVLLRGLGRLDVFPGDDIGGQNRFQEWFDLPQRPDYAGVQEILERWRPYRGLLYFYLLENELARRGLVQAYNARGRQSA